MFNDLRDQILQPGPTPYNGRVMFGIIDEINEENHTVILKDSETQNLKWGPCFVLSSGISDGGSAGLPKVGTPVLWLFINQRLGVVLGRVIQQGAGPNDSGSKYYIVTFPSGNQVTFDSSSGEFSVVADTVLLGNGATEPVPKGSKLNDYHDTLYQFIGLLNTAIGALAGSPPITPAQLANWQSQQGLINSTAVKIK